MELYNKLIKKLKNNTITKKEKKLLFQMAFGKKFMKSNDKGRLKEYKI